MSNFQDFYAAGNVPEDVIRAFYDISPTDARFTMGVEQVSADSAYKEYFEHALAAPDKNNAAIDGAAITDYDTSQGDRRLSPCQLPERGIQLGDQAEGSDGYGPNITKFDTQLEFRVQELYRDIEAAALSENASQLQVSGTTPGKLPGFFACVATNTRSNGTDGGWNGTIFAAPTPGATRALPESEIHEVLAEINTQGGRPDQMHMIPLMKSQFTQYMMTSSARIGAIYTPTQGGSGGATAVASIQMFESDFGAMEVIANQIMQAEEATRTNVAIVDSRYWACATQWDPRAKRLGADGHGESWLVSASKTLCALNERASGAVRDVNHTVAMVP